MKNVRENFSSIHKMLSVIDSREKNSVMCDRNASVEHDYDFTFTHSYKEAETVFQEGYVDVLPKIKSGVSENLRRTEIRNRRHVETNVVGYCPHVPNAILGLPNSMILTKTQPQKVKAVSIVVDVTENCGTNAEEFVNSGVTVLSAINSLELRGYRVNLKVAFFNGEANNQKATAIVSVKDYREHLDLQKLCFPLCHPSMLRRFGFRWLETAPEIEDNSWTFGYGRHSKTSSFLEKNEIMVTLDRTKNCEYDPEKLIQSMYLE